MQDEIRIHKGPSDLDDDIEPEYDLDTMERAYDQENRLRAHARAHLIRLDADIAAYFKNAATINAVLRRAMELAREIEEARRVAA